MRILHVIDSLNPRMGGLPKAALSLALAQSGQGAEVALTYYSTAELEEEIVQHYRFLPGFDSLRRLPILSVDRWDWLTGRPARRRFQEARPDVLHTHGLWEPILHHAHTYGRHMKSPVVISPHSMLHPWQNRHRRLEKSVLKRILGWQRDWREAAWVQALTEREAAHLRKQGFQRVEVLPNGIFPSEDLEPAGEWLHGLEGHPFLLFLGRLDRVKGLDRLVDAFSRIFEAFPDLYLVLAGPDYGVRDKLIEQGQSLGIAGRILFPGMLRGREKWSALHQTLCFCLPSLSEGCSMSVLEAGLAGAPIAMSDACDLPEWFDEGAALRLPADPEGMAATLTAFLNNPGEGWNLGSRARARVQTHHDWDQIAHRMLRLYSG